MIGGRNKKELNIEIKKTLEIQANYPAYTPHLDVVAMITLLTTSNGWIPLEFLINQKSLLHTQYEITIRNGYMIGVNGILLVGESRRVKKKLSGFKINTPIEARTYTAFQQGIMTMGKLLDRWPRVLVMVAGMSPDISLGVLQKEYKAKVKGKEKEYKKMLEGRRVSLLTLFSKGIGGLRMLYDDLVYDDIPELVYGSGIVVGDGKLNNTKPDEWYLNIIAGFDMTGVVLVANSYKLPVRLGVNILFGTPEPAISVPVEEGGGDGEEEQ